MSQDKLPEATLPRLHQSPPVVVEAALERVGATENKLLQKVGLPKNFRGRYAVASLLWTKPHAYNITT